MNLLLRLVPQRVLCGTAKTRFLSSKRAIRGVTSTDRPCGGLRHKLPKQPSPHRSLLPSHYGAYSIMTHFRHEKVLTARKGSFAPIGPGTVPVETVKVSHTTQSRVGSFTYKRFTVPQEVHRSAKRLSRFPLSDPLKRPFSFSLQRRPGCTSPPPPEAETVRPLMSCEPPQCSHVLLGMRKYSP